MKYFIEWIKDVFGNNYLGINIPIYVVEPFLEKLKSILGEEDFEKYTKLQQNRDNGHYHITLINVMDYTNLLTKMGIDGLVNSLENVFRYEIDDLKLLGIGKASKNSNTTYFIVVKSQKLQDIRDTYNLPEQDFHITIGFKYKDVFGVRKNEVLSEEKLEFFNHLKNLYYKNNEKFDFLKDMENFNLDKDDNIVAIEINNTSAVFKCGKYTYFTICLFDDKFKIACLWEDKKELPMLSTTILSKIFK